MIVSVIVHGDSFTPREYSPSARPKWRSSASLSRSISNEPDQPSGKRKWMGARLSGLIFSSTTSGLLVNLVMTFGRSGPFGVIRSSVISRPTDRPLIGMDDSWQGYWDCVLRRSILTDGPPSTLIKNFSMTDR